MQKYTNEQAEAAVMSLALDARARIAGVLLNSLSGTAVDEAWLEELRWQLQDWYAGVRHDPVDDLLDDPTPVLFRPRRTAGNAL